MTLPVKVFLGCGGLAAVSLAGCYFGGVWSDTPWVSLKVEDGTRNTYQNKVGAAYSMYLLAVHGTEGDRQNFNRSKWVELYRKYKKEGGESAEFAEGKVKDAYDSSPGDAAEGAKSLNKVCKSVYGKTEGGSNDVDFSNPSGTNPRDKLARDLLKYCSPLGKKPIVIGNDEDYPANSIGSDTANKAVLVSTNNAANYYFWVAQERWFLSETAPKNDAFFGTFFDGGKLKWSLKRICHRAYGLTGGDSPTKEAPKTDDVKKYCSFWKITTSN